MSKNFTFGINDGDVLDVSIPKGKPVYRKELIYEGKFSKDDFEFDITLALMDHWLSSFETMQDAGIDVPAPVEHTTDPEKRRGTCIGMQRGIDSKGREALFGYIEFNDEESAKLSNSQVSIYVPAERPANGTEKPLKNVISHVAITDYPVVNDLDGFEIAASLTPAKESKPMLLKKLATELGLSLSDDADDQGSYDAILSHVKELSLAIEDMKKKAPPFKKKDDEDEDDKEKMKKEVAASFALKFSGTEAKTRKAQIGTLVSTGKITKAVADDLEKTFCKEESLCLAFGSDGSFTDSFESTFEALSKNEPVLSFTERTGSQASTSETDNPMVKESLKRAEAFKKGN